MTAAETRGAEALGPMLSAFHSMGDRILQSVWQYDTEGSVDRVALDFGGVSSIVSADENDDSIGISAEQGNGARNASGVNPSCLEPWNRFIGKAFGWGWLTINQQGYCDGLLLSFDGIVPQIFLNAIASSIRIGAITAAA